MAPDTWMNARAFTLEIKQQGGVNDSGCICPHKGKTTLLARVHTCGNLATDGDQPEHDLLMEKRDEWDATPPIQRVTQSIDARLIQLTTKTEKSGSDFKEIDLLTRQLKN